ncbi:hypothetical protein C8R43DRAFT_1188412 [Mycena crocata]|nr:hypothetical protein C8R43DRAFT_1188412 [Mycena crocata]
MGFLRKISGSEIVGNFYRTFLVKVTRSLLSKILADFPPVFRPEKAGTFEGEKSEYIFREEKSGNFPEENPPGKSGIFFAIFLKENLAFLLGKILPKKAGNFLHKSCSGRSARSRRPLSSRSAGSRRPSAVARQALGALSDVGSLNPQQPPGHVRNRARVQCRQLSVQKEKSKGKGFWGRGADNDHNRERERALEMEAQERERGRERRDEENELTRKIGFLTAPASEDWTLVLDVCNHASADESNAKEAVRALRREFKYGEPAASGAASRCEALGDYAPQLRYVYLAVHPTLEDLLTSSRTSPVVQKDAGFRGLWRRLKPRDKPEEGMPFDTDDAMFNPPLTAGRGGVGMSVGLGNMYDYDPNSVVAPVVTYHDVTGPGPPPLPAAKAPKDCERKRERQTSENWGTGERESGNRDRDRERERDRLITSGGRDRDRDGGKKSGDKAHRKHHRHRIIPPNEDMRRLFQECKIGVGKRYATEPGAGDCDAGRFGEHCHFGSGTLVPSNTSRRVGLVSISSFGLIRVFARGLHDSILSTCFESFVEVGWNPKAVVESRYSSGCEATLDFVGYKSSYWSFLYSFRGVAAPYSVSRYASHCRHPFSIRVVWQAAYANARFYRNSIRNVSTLKNSYSRKSLGRPRARSAAALRRTKRRGNRSSGRVVGGERGAHGGAEAVRRLEEGRGGERRKTGVGERRKACKHLERSHPRPLLLSPRKPSPHPETGFAGSRVSAADLANEYMANGVVLGAAGRVGGSRENTASSGRRSIDIEEGLDCCPVLDGEAHGRPMQQSAKVLQERKIVVDTCDRMGECGILSQLVFC